MMKYFLALLLVATQINAQDDARSMAMGLWKPTQPGECSMELHDSYSAVGPDGKLYPIWHPTVDPSGCNFGHEHGDNPATSPLGDEPGEEVLFGYVNEQHALVQTAIPGHRHEDHVGHKIAVREAVQMGYYVKDPITGANVSVNISCDMLAKLHQGTHSKDALTNSMHEQYHRMSCSDGTFVNVQLLSQIGRGGFIEIEGSTDVYVGVPTPSDSPITSNVCNPGRSMGDRDIPSITGLAKSRPGFFEQWRTQNAITKADNSGCAIRFANYWGVGNPARFYDPAKPDKMGTSLDICWLTVPETGAYLVISAPCTTVRTAAGNDPTAIGKYDIASGFNGASRNFRPDSFTFRSDVDDGSTINAAGNREWYTNALGTVGSPTYFPGAVKQEVSVGTHAPVSQYAIRSKVVTTDYGNGNGVHAPN